MSQRLFRDISKWGGLSQVREKSLQDQGELYYKIVCAIEHYCKIATRAYYFIAIRDDSPIQ